VAIETIGYGVLLHTGHQREDKQNPALIWLFSTKRLVRSQMAG
jgi:hypothetical protein